jgi:ParB family chromosome partitioning protein
MAGEMKFDRIPIADIKVSEANVRKGDVEEGLEELANSIEEIGLQQPVVVYERDGKYHLIIGQRRYLACKQLGWKKIPALIRPVPDETQAAIISFSENIHRLDLDYRDKMRVAVELLSKMGSAKKVATALGVTEQTVKNYIGYAAVPETLKEMVDNGRISATTATRIARSVPDEQEAIGIAEKVIEEPTSERRRLIIDVAKENPGKKASEIVKLSKKKKFSTITLNLTPRIANALETACRDYGGEPVDIANEALEEWLGKRGFLR